MLYRTHHPFFFQFNPFTSSTPPPPFATTTTRSHPLRSSVALSVQGEEADMECVQRALKKSSFRPEVGALRAPVPSPQGFFDDFWSNTPQIGVAADEFFVDDLLDFSNGGVAEEEEEKENPNPNKGFISVSPKKERRIEENCNNCILNAKDELCSESVPADELANLEWLSHFVDDSFSEFSLTYAPAVTPGAGGNSSQQWKKDALQNRSEPESAKACFTTPVPAKARSKRARTGGRRWSSQSPSGTADSSTTSSTSSISSSPSTSWLVHSNAEFTIVQAEKAPPPAARASKKKKRSLNEAAANLSHARRCSHCGVQKTPQWRAGPLGAKTLCNACGVRFKSGRLLPEYRPACSPTFSRELHSNSHRKVLEMRRQKEDGSCSEPGMSPAVQSC